MSYRLCTLALATIVCGACTEPTAPPPPAVPGASGEPAAAPAAIPAAEAPAGDADVMPAAAGDTDADVAAMVPDAHATDLAAAPVKMPEGWKGTGVLARRTDRPPRRAPAWASIAAEVVDRDGQRLLVVTGRAPKIKDVHLARSTAENRARDEARRWTGVEKQENGAIKEVWRDPRTGDTFAQLELPVAADWAPGR